MVGESLENFSLEGVQQQGETVKKAWVSFQKQVGKSKTVCELVCQGNKGRRNPTGIGNMRVLLLHNSCFPPLVELSVIVNFC